MRRAWTWLVGRPVVLLPLLGTGAILASLPFDEPTKIASAVLSSWGANILAFWIVLRYGEEVLARVEQARIRAAHEGQRRTALTLPVEPAVQVITHLTLCLHKAGFLRSDVEAIPEIVARIRRELATFSETDGALGRPKEADVALLWTVAAPAVVPIWHATGSRLFQAYQLL